MVRVNIVGAGKVGQTLMLLMAGLDGVIVQDVLSQRRESALRATELAKTGRAVDRIADMGAADLWLLTVPDDRIAGVAEQLAGSAAPAMAVHCSGFLSSAVLGPLGAAGWRVASCHPVLSFADPQSAAQQFAGTYCAVEGDSAAVQAITDLVERMGGIPFAVNAQQKALYHAAAVFSNNFAVVVQGIAQDAWAAAGVPQDVAKALGDKLLGGAAANVARLGPQAALTGPAARGDTEVLDAQGAAVAAWHPEAGQAYRVLSDLGWRLKQTGATKGDA
ncbi:Rossmann-like and DUF2520 domain-containing protein [Donghicola mangrovi]|uniref:DUF2520 domain-containing protein n=1 Tax=Donghicola mangrovi TaxID=2729614 RepID=A0A850Q9W3_9RHOB|nr:Rossmann-like and DUF2520 domain-containing protein [Donghicola mangrovi]NVO25042.1 DUF2520 domain-containing protein [Donghicola mangrovi]